MSDKHISRSGGCFCGAVRYRVDGPLRGVVNCHCSQCQKLNGNFGAHAKALSANIEITNGDGLSWFQITKTARRAFCNRCGSALFWEAQGQSGTGIIAGSLDDSGELQTIGHIFVGEKPGYYEICDDLPQFDGSSEGALPGDSL